ncbi:MAG: hypothetical protein VX223_04535 [Myxococcota bacterium]|nr:hypothetical protein [Myxococcota bacterium]
MQQNRQLVSTKREVGSPRILRVITALTLMLLYALPAMADAGDDWVAAFKKGKAKTAAKVSSPTSLRYGNAGATKDVSGIAAITKTYKKFFRKLKKQFKTAELEVGTCTSAGRELGYMAQEWKTKSESMADWIRSVPQDFCNGMDPIPPKVTLLKVLGDDLPHALVLFQTGEEQLVSGVFHF